MSNTMGTRSTMPSGGSGGAGGKILALLIGFVVGAVSVVGGVIGAGYYAITKPIDDVAGKVDGLVGNNSVSDTLKQYLSEEYYQGTVKNLFGGVMSAVDELKGGSGSFSTLNKLSPSVEKAIKTLAEKIYDLGAGNPSDTKEDAVSKLTATLMDTPFSKLGDAFAGEGDSILNTVRLGDMLLKSGAFTFETLTSDKLMMTLLYGDSSAYTLDTENKKIVMNAGYEQLTIKKIREGGVSGMIENIPLDTVVGATDGMMQALLWGPADRYELDENSGQPVYKQISYTLEQRDGDDAAMMYNDVGSAYAPTLLEGTDTYTITVNGKTQYLKPTATPNVYLAYNDQNGEKSLHYKKTTMVDLQQPEALLNSMELGTILNLTPTSDDVMLRLAYGEKDVDWTVSAEKIVMLGGKKATTVGDLRGDALTDTLNGMPINALMEIDESDALMRTLAYGAAYRYAYDANAPEGTNKITMNQVRYTLDETEGVFKDEDGEALTLEVAARAVLPTPDTNGVYTLVIVDKNGNKKTQYVKQTGESGDTYYYAWKTAECDGAADAAGNKILYAAQTIGDLRESPEKLLNGIELGGVMNLNHTSDEIMLTLAYGEKGKDWDFITGADGKNTGLNIISKPKTIGDLRDSEDLSGMLNSLQLNSVMSIDNGDAMMRTLAFGAEYRYTYDKTANTVTMNEIVYTVKDGKLVDGGDNEIKLATGSAFNPALETQTVVVVLNETDGETEEQYLKKVSDGVYKVYETAEYTTVSKYTPTTIGDLRDDPDGLMNSIELAGVLNLDHTSDELMLTLAYGEKGKDWNFITGADGKNTGLNIIGKPKTIGDLRNSEDMTEMLNSMALDSIMSIDCSDAMMRTLAYGAEYRYTYNKTNKTVTMNEIVYYYKDGKLVDGGDNEIKLASGSAFNPTAETQTIAVIVKEADGETAVETEERYLKKVSDGVYKVYETAEYTTVSKYAPTTLGELRDNPDELMNSIQLGSVLNLDHTSDEMMLVLAYGEKGKDWEFVTDTNGNKTGLTILGTPKTIGDLRNSEDMSETLNSMQLPSLMDINNGDVLMRTLAYGAEYRYTYNKTANTVTMNEIVYTVKDGKLLDGGDNEIKLASGSAFNPALETQTIVVVLNEADGETEEQFLKKVENGVYKVYETAEYTTARKYKPTTLGDLRDNPDGLINDIELGQMMELTPADYETNKIMVALAYGEKGVDWIADETDATKFKMLGDSKPTTIKDLQEGGMTDKLNDMPLSTIMTIDEADAMMRSLAFGPSWKHGYNPNAAAGTRITLFQVEYAALDDANNKLSDKRGNEIENVADIQEVSAGVYKVVLNTGRTDENNAVITETQYVKLGANGNYFAWKTAECDSIQGNELRYKETTLWDLQNDPDKLMKSLELATVMGLDETANPILRAIAFGTEGKATDSEGDYYIDKTKPQGQQIVMRPGKYYKTIDELQGDSLNQTIENLPLKTIMEINNDDGMLRALAYGANWKYTYTDGMDEPQMNAIVYTLKGGKLVDGGDNEIETVGFDGALNANQAVQVKNGEAYVTQYLRYNGDGTYTVCKDGSYLEEVKYKETTVGDLQNDPSSILNGIELGSALNVTPNSPRVLIALAYGTEDVDYEIKTKTVDGAEVKYISPIHSPRTLNDLTGEKSNDVINGIAIGDAVDVTPDSHPVLVALAYGEEGVDWEYDKMNGKFRMLGDSKPNTLADMSGEKSEGLINGITLEAALSVNADSDGMMKSLAYGREDVHYSIEETVENGTTVKRVQMQQKRYTLNGAEFFDVDGEKVQATDETVTGGYKLTFTDGGVEYVKEDGGVYLAYADDAFTTPTRYKKTTLGDMSKDTSKLLDNVTLADALSVNEKSHSVLIALAYGEKGVDYHIDTTKPEGKQIVPMNNPRTISALTGDKSTALINGITLEDALGVNADSDGMMRAIAFGRENEHYKINQTTKEIEMQQVVYTRKNGVWTDIDGKTVTAIENSGTYVVSAADGTVHYVKETDGKYLAYTDVGFAVPAKYRKKTIQDMSGNTEDLLNNVLIADALKIDSKSHPVLIALAYDSHKIENKGTSEEKLVGENPRTLAALMGDNSMDIINDITLEDALSITYESESMMRALAFGQQNVNYTVDETTKEIVMSQVFYTYKQNVETHEEMFFDCHDVKLDTLSISRSENVTAEYTYFAEVAIHTQDGTQTKYLASHNEITYYEFTDSTYTEGVYYQKATLGSLSQDSSVMLDNITLADAMGIKSYKEETDQMKKALAYSKDGKTAYTLGQLRNDPSQIVDNIHLDSLMDPDPNSAMVMYLLYGKAGIHYEVKAESALTAEEKEHATKIGQSTNYVVSQKKILAVHLLDGELHLHNEYGDPVMQDKLDASGNPVIGSDGNVVQEYVKVSVATAEEAAMGVAYTYNFDGQHYHLHTANSKKIRIKMTSENDSKKQEVQAYYVKTELIVDEDTGETEWDYLFYEHNTVDDLTSGDAELMTHLTDRLTLEEVIGSQALNDNNFLSHLKHTTIEELPTAIDSLTVAEVFETDVYEANKDSNGNIIHYYILNNEGVKTPLYKNNETGVFTLANGTIVENPARILTGTWKYLLTDSDLTDGYTAPETYKVTDISELVPNMTGNMQNATLNDLQADGIIDFGDNADIVEKEIVYTFPDGGFTIVNMKPVPTYQTFPKYTYTLPNGTVVEKTTIGQLTVSELIDYVSNIISLI